MTVNLKEIKRPSYQVEPNICSQVKLNWGLCDLVLDNIVWEAYHLHRKDYLK